MIYQDVAKARSAHSAAIKAQEEAANEAAERQYDLDVAEAATVAALRASGAPAALIPKLARGEKRVAEARKAMAVAEGVYRAAQARTQATYLDWKMADEQYAREWSQAGRG